jgi:hypothetical protein
MIAGTVIYRILFEQSVSWIDFAPEQFPCVAQRQGKFRRGDFADDHQVNVAITLLLTTGYRSVDKDKP